MALNPDAVGTRSEPTRSSWDSKDSLIYALGVGAGTESLHFTTENSNGVSQRAIPTMGVVLADVSGAFATIGSFNPAMLVHGEQSIEMHSLLPVAGEIETVSEITNMFDKGNGAVVVVAATSIDVATQQPLFSTTMSVHIRGEGGWGGDRGPRALSNPVADRTADVTSTLQTSPNQALMYRLSGDRNPLHSDPMFAEMAGFDRPILHGLCTFGFTGRALMAHYCDNQPNGFSSMSGRFTAPVMPGDALNVSMWEVDGEIVFQTMKDDGTVVIDQGRATCSKAE